MSFIKDLPVFKQPTRREFCGGALSLVSLGALYSACGGSATAPSDVPALPIINASLAGGAIAITVDAASPINPVGGAALVQTSSGDFLVAQTSAGVFTALTATCTHEACTVTGISNNRYVCPCHGSEYTTAGSVVQGPAPASLRQFATTFANNVLTIKVA